METLSFGNFRNTQSLGRISSLEEDPMMGALANDLMQPDTSNPLVGVGQGGNIEPPVEPTLETVALDGIILGERPIEMPGAFREPDTVDVRPELDPDPIIGVPVPPPVFVPGDFEIILPLPDDQLLSQNSPGVKFGSETFDRMGEVVATGDFNGDGYTDLAVGSPDEDALNVADAGMVNVIYGSANGLNAAGSQFWTQNSPGISSGQGTEAGDNFGETLTAGDFNGDGFVDLAVGSPGEDVFDIVDAGAVNVIYGSANGLNAIGDQIWHQDSGEAQASPVISSVAEAGDRFGGALTAGDFDGDGRDDLAVGSPGESVGNIEDAGAAVVIYGSANRLSANGHQTWHQNRTGILDEAETGDRFAASLTAGDFNGDGIDDLGIGVPEEDIDNASNAGAVNVIYGTANRLSATGDQFWHQNSFGVQGVAQGGENSEFGFLGDRFGTSLTAADFNGDGIDDLGVGVPGEDLGVGVNSIDVGGVNILNGSDNRLTGLSDRFVSQDTLDITGEPPESRDRFGWSVAGGDFNGDGRADLLTGIPGKQVDNLNGAGAVGVLYDV
ncbi:FG-GAP repeat protein [Oscillatoriales cyanobacterium LEGE 11467]|uniref:FG-GAP repeat protein n=1 Tax=Zarconia navalis LEGE 11467 TaxID=1828826 RepID=A0A928Z8Z2_9CYAN|nr:FG-GAP-like repeat-containing protein [Zarconia navalis]MBE9041139.1 FG-GAP repeat protein [Zarconia navalis LEGE 11467]